MRDVKAVEGEFHRVSQVKLVADVTGLRCDVYAGDVESRLLVAARSAASPREEIQAAFLHEPIVAAHAAFAEKFDVVDHDVVALESSERR